MKAIFALLLAVFLCEEVSAATPPAFPESHALDGAMLKALKARSIGPAVMSGRVADLALDPSDPATFYVALGTGGLMKTSNNGATWAGVMDKEAVAAIGAVAVAPSDPKVVWVGTGEANDRNSSSWGDGVYRSTDGGDTWVHAGLKDTKAIARIVVDPGNPQVAYAAAMGDLWNWGGERGCYKTTDGGAKWKLVLAAAQLKERVGCGDIAMDPTNSSVLYAALYARQRKPWSFVYGPGATEGKDLGGIYKSDDAGTTWRKLENGLPKMTGRIGLAVHLKNPRIVDAVVQSDEGGTRDLRDIRSKRGGVFRSDDGGETWKRMSPLNPRPFYFSQIRVDPENDQRVYLLGMALHVSDDGGTSFREDLFDKVHPDNHALAIDPQRPSRLLLGTDGGPYLSWDGGKTWQILNNFPAGEYYRINTDMSTPYRICGGLQDNLNWVGPSRTRTKDGILNSDWINIGGGDGFYCVFDPTDPDLVYTESQQGFVHRFNLANGQVKRLRPEAAEGQSGYRFHWNAPLIGSRHEEGTLYLGGNHVFRLTHHGEHWDRISPDLSTGELAKMIAAGSGAENYGVVYALAESPLMDGLLWAGTDDGKLWLTKDDGVSWTDLTSKLPAAAKGQWIFRIEASGHDADVAYMAVDAHRMGNYAPLLYRTDNGGRSWQAIASNLPAGGPVKVVREDPKNPNLLFAGTEFGLFVSMDRGGSWTRLGELPTVAIDDIVIHPRDADLVVGTHGRSLFIIDDIGPLQELTADIAGQDAHIFTPRDALGSYLLPGSADWTGKADFRGANPPEGALISFYLKSFTGEQAVITITNALDQPVAKFKLPGTPGINRFSWDLKPTEEVLTKYGGDGDKFVRPGEYTITLNYGKAKVTQKLNVAIASGIETR